MYGYLLSYVAPSKCIVSQFGCRVFRYKRNSVFTLPYLTLPHFTTTTTTSQQQHSIQKTLRYQYYVADQQQQQVECGYSYILVWQGRPGVPARREEINFSHSAITCYSPSYAGTAIQQHQGYLRRVLLLFTWLYTTSMYICIKHSYHPHPAYR